MERAHLDELIGLERTYWWHLAKRRLVVETLLRWFPPPGRLVEGGLGAGGNLLAFRDLGYAVSGFDLMDDAVAYCRSQGVEDVRVHDLEQPWPVPPGSCRAVVLLDVIEHLDEPVEALKQAAACLTTDRSAGIVVSVPALGMLMGPWDRALGHRRRYSRRMLAEQAAAAGLKVARATYWNSFSLPPALALRTFDRFIGREKPAEFPRVSRPVNAGLLAAAAVERAFLRVCPMPLGLSILGVLTK